MLIKNDALVIKRGGEVIKRPHFPKNFESCVVGDEFEKRDLINAESQETEGETVIKLRREEIVPTVEGLKKIERSFLLQTSVEDLRKRKLWSYLVGGGFDDVDEKILKNCFRSSLPHSYVGVREASLVNPYCDVSLSVARSMILSRREGGWKSGTYDDLLMFANRFPNFRFRCTIVALGSTAGLIPFAPCIRITTGGSAGKRYLTTTQLFGEFIFPTIFLIVRKKEEGNLLLP